jgi:hypothetical protein
MFSLLSFSTWALTVTHLMALAQGLSTGAAQCHVGESSAGGLHLRAANITTGLLQEFGLEVLLNGQVLSDANATDFVVGRDHLLTLRSTTGAIFRGLLFSLGAGDNRADTTDALDVAPESAAILRVASVCIAEDVGGLTHVNNLGKTEAAGVLRMDEMDSNLILDVTVVIENRNDVSSFYYTQYTLNAVEGDGSMEDGPQLEAVLSAASQMMDIAVISMLVVLSMGLWNLAI